jgi:hypothetical protein
MIKFSSFKEADVRSARRSQPKESLSISTTSTEDQFEVYYVHTVIRGSSADSRSTERHSVSQTISGNPRLTELWDELLWLLEGPLESDNQGSASDELR